MKLKSKYLLSSILFLVCGFLVAQTTSDSTAVVEKSKNADDPSSFFTRVEVFNEFQHYETGINLDQTVIRTIVKIGKKFTTRLDVPLVHFGYEDKGYDKFGLGDISFRLLGYKLRETRLAALTASIEIQLNTAYSPPEGIDAPPLGTGKNLLIPLITYTDFLKTKRDMISGVLQQVITIGGDEKRNNLNFTKIQAIYLHFWSKRLWSVVADEFFVDYENDAATSMIIKGRMVNAPNPRLNIWLQGNVGVYGDFVSRYQWGTEVGLRYFLLRSMNLKKARMMKDSEGKY